MEYLVLLAIIVPLIAGLLLGMLRGWRRATLRIVLVILCLVAAFCLKGAITDKVMSVEIEGKPMQEYLLSSLPAEYAPILEALLPIVQLFVMAIVFLALFFGLKFISWAIVFPICKIFVKKARKKEDGTYGRKGVLIGGAIGLVQGACVAVVLAVMLNGLFYNISNVMGAVNSLADSSSGSNDNQAAVRYLSASEEEEVPDNNGGLPISGNPMEMLVAYKDSQVCNAVSNGGGNKLFDVIVSIKTEDGRTLTLTGQLDAVTAIIKTIKSVLKLQEVFGGKLNITLAEGIKEIFNELDALTADLSDESKETITRLLQSTASAMLPDNVGVDFGKLDFGNINFKNEGEVLSSLAEYKEKDLSGLSGEEAKQEAQKVVNLVFESDIILPVLSNSGEFSAGLAGVNHEVVEDLVGELEKDSTKDPKKVEMLKNFFGLNEAANSN